jgi:hypothetical protein
VSELPGVRETGSFNFPFTRVITRQTVADRNHIELQGNLMNLARLAGHERPVVDAVQDDAPGWQ